MSVSKAKPDPLESCIRRTYLGEAAIALGFDEWLRQYTEDPNAFEDITAAVLEALEQRGAGKPLTHGQECVAVLKAMILDGLRRAGRIAPNVDGLGSLQADLVGRLESGPDQPTEPESAGGLEGE